MSTQHQALTSKVFDLFQYEKILQNSTIGFLLLLQLANKRKKLFIYRRGAHGLLKEGAPSGGMWAAKWGEWAATSPPSPTSVNKLNHKGEGATSCNHRLPPQEGATSPRGAHLPRPTSSISKRFPINQHPIKWILSPLTFGLTLS
jgi:hypothetical protein